MPWILADEEGRICEARKKIYNTERGAKMGYKAALDNYMQCWYLYDDDLDYNFYVNIVLASSKSTSYLRNVIAQTNPVTITDEMEDRWNELVDQFKSIYSIQEVTMSLGKK